MAKKEVERLCMHTAIEILEDRTLTRSVWEHLGACALHRALKTAPTSVTYEAKVQNGRPYGDAKRKTNYNSGKKAFQQNPSVENLWSSAVT